MIWRLFLVGICTVLLGLNTHIVSGQTDDVDEEDEVTFLPILYDTPVQGRISDRAYFDFWHFNAQEGDLILVRMRGEEGLAPLIGISGNNREVIARSDVDENGEELPDAEPNGMVELQFLVPQNGEYSIVATRAGRELGDTEGRYLLILTRISSVESRRELARQAVEFRCQEELVITALTVQLPSPLRQTVYRVTVYGLDDFEPAIRVFIGADDIYEYCTTDGQNTESDTVTFWDMPTMTISNPPQQTAQYGLNTLGGLGQITFTIASVNGGRGRYIALIEGFELERERQINPLDLQIGPVALGSDVIIYMLKTGESRIDPLMTHILFDRTEIARCDDAGMRGCEDIPSAESIRITMRDDTIIQGDRFSAGLRLTPLDVERVNLELSSRAQSATGHYALVIIGELPAIVASD